MSGKIGHNAEFQDISFLDAKFVSRDFFPGINVREQVMLQCLSLAQSHHKSLILYVMGIYFHDDDDNVS